MLKDKETVYFNNAATSWPKPNQVYIGIRNCIVQPPVEFGRSNTASEVDILTLTRSNLAKFINFSNPNRIFFTYNATYAINQILFGIEYNPNDFVVSTELEHNAVLRPVLSLRHRFGVRVELAQINEQGLVNLDHILELIKKKPKVVILSHASNVTGTVQPAEAIFKAAKEVGAITILDAAQTIGIIPFDTHDLNADAIVFTGHKYLLGPTGIAGACLADDFTPNTFLTGGSGILSESEEMPEELPIRYEPGTHNFVGAAGLNEAINWLYMHWRPVKAYKWYFEILKLLRSYPNVVINETPEYTTPVISFSLKNWSVADVSYILRTSYNVVCRAGLHCAPLIHKHLKTGPAGCVRLSPSQFTQAHDFARLACALDTICKSE